MNKKVGSGFILCAIAIALASVGIVFCGKAAGLGLLYTGADIGLIYLVYPALFLLALIFLLIGLRKIRKNFKRKPKAPKLKPVLCSACGAKNSAGDRFCQNCRAELAV
jgi:hypothetical protein